MDIYRKLENINTKLNNIEETLININSKLIELEETSKNIDKPISFIDSTFNYLKYIFTLSPLHPSSVITSLIIFAI